MQMFYYDEQIRRYLLQFTRMISLFQVEYGRNEQGTSDLIRVPVRYGDASRQAQTIIQQNSANSLPSTPLITFYITGMDYDRPRMQEPYHVNKMQVRQRTYNTDTQDYETTQGNAFTIERLMPVPYNMTISMDIWTSNTNQKMQIFEQIATLFNPSLEIQSSENYIDWTSLSVVNLEKVNWSSRTIPVGTENPIDIMTLTFGIPIWISSPAKVKKLGVVERVVASIFDANGDAANAILNNDLLLGTRLKVTPWNYQVALLDGQLQILQPNEVLLPDRSSLSPFTFPVVENPQITWPSVIGAYGVLRPGISYITLDDPWNQDASIVGTITVNPSDDRLIIYNIDPDTIPQDSLLPVNSVINPLLSGPNIGLPAPTLGQRYLITEPTGNTENSQNPLGWTGSGGQPLLANANDIIEFNGVRWEVAFDSLRMTETQYVTNLTTGIQYKWNGQAWVKSVDGLYPGGSWNLVL
jgi:T4-like virus Myoviridae tail sheath stabiliser